ncbi:MAG: flagellin, partial [bacterium]
TEYTKNQILVQSATAMLAQSNTLPQSVLTLVS